MYPSLGWYPLNPGADAPRSEFFGIVKRPLGSKITVLDLFKRTFLIGSYLDEDAESFGAEQRSADDFISSFPAVSAVGGLFLTFDYPPYAIRVEANYFWAQCP